ncbi:MAG: MBL fold metallo-hydrolase [Mangrovicoccus sp.]
MKRRQFLSLAPAVTLGTLGVSFLPASTARAEGKGTQFTAVQRFSLGDWTVTALGDGYLPLGEGVLQGITTEAAKELAAAAYFDTDNMVVGVNAYVVETGSDLILIDVGTGTAFGPTLGLLANNLKAAGYAPEDATTILATHLHPDHIGGCLIDGANPFVNAKMVATQADFDFFTSDEIRAQAPEAFRGFFDLAKAVTGFFADKLTLIGAAEVSVAPGITAIPLPGHTLGHVGYMLESGGESLLIWGDVLHVPGVQFARPDVTVAFDIDQETARKTRMAILDQVATDRQLVAGMHMSFPGFGYVEKAAEGYRFVPAPWRFS